MSLFSNHTRIINSGVQHYLWPSSGKVCPFLIQQTFCGGCPVTVHVKIAAWLRSMVCWDGVTRVSRALLTVKLTSILSAPAVLFIMHTQMPESSMSNSWRMSTSKWKFTFWLGNTCRNPTPSTLNHLKIYISTKKWVKRSLIQFHDFTGM